MAQHSAYLGMARGLRTTTSYVPPPRQGQRLRRQMAVPTLAAADVDDPAVATRPASPVSPPLAPQITSPFANRIQTQLASVMRTMSSQEPH
jgi:hypothetical protein